MAGVLRSAPLTRTYELVEGKGIRCLLCGLTSWNPTDVEVRYCVRCHRYHDDPPPDHISSLLLCSAAAAGSCTRTSIETGQPSSVARAIASVAEQSRGVAS